MSDDKWERVLWKKQLFPDNYLPPSFLSSLRRNANFQPYGYWELCVAACAISQHLSVLYIFLVTFVHFYLGLWDPRVLVWVSVVVFLSGYTLWEILEWYLNVGSADKRENRARAIKSSILTFLALMSLSPVLRTLTAASSSDSIWAMAACLFILNAVLADYGPSRTPLQSRERLSSVLSMNAAISASVVLASRLRNDTSVFALMLFSIQLFALYPILRTRLSILPVPVIILHTVCLASLSMWLGVRMSTFVTCLHAAMLVFITFIAPALLVWAQKFKNEIRGPWDVAIPQVR